MPANRKFDISNSPPLITSALTFIVLDCSLEGGAPRTFPIAMELSVDVDNELVGLFVLVVLATSVDSIPFLSFFEDCFPFAFVVLAFGGATIFMDGDTFSATLTLSPTVIVLGLDFFDFDAGTIFSVFSFFDDTGAVFFDLVPLLPLPLLLIVFPGVGGFCCVVVFSTLLRFISSRRYLRWVSSAAMLSRDWMRARVSLR